MRLFFIAVLFLICSVSSSGQNPIMGSWFKEIDHVHWIAHYSKEYKEDSLNLDRKWVDEMVLLVGDTTSLFTSYNRLRNDTLLRYMRDQKTGMSMEENLNYWINSLTPARFEYIVFKNYPTGVLRYYDVLFSTFYAIDDTLNNIQWENLPGEESRILGYQVHKATTQYGGRTWQAWFCPDIPINDGPLIFHGLPGLIVKLQDTRQHYTFTLTSIEKTAHPRPMKYKKPESREPIYTDLAGYIKAYYTFINSFIIHAEEAQLPTETQLRASETMRQRNNPMFLNGEKNLNQK